MWMCSHVHMNTLIHVHVDTYIHIDVDTCPHVDMNTMKLNNIKNGLYRYCPWMRGMATSQISCNNGIDKKASHVPL